MVRGRHSQISRAQLDQLITITEEQRERDREGIKVSNVESGRTRKKWPSRGDVWLLGAMTGSRPSARDHTLNLTLELLRFVSSGEHLWQYVWLVRSVSSPLWGGLVIWRAGARVTSTQSVSHLEETCVSEEPHALVPPNCLNPTLYTDYTDAYIAHVFIFVIPAPDVCPPTTQ